MSDNQVPVLFNFKAFDSISNTISSLSGKFTNLKAAVTENNNRFQVMQAKTEGVRSGLEAFGEKVTGIGAKISLGISAPLSLLGAKMVHTAIEATESAS